MFFVLPEIVKLVDHELANLTALSILLLSSLFIWFFCFLIASGLFITRSFTIDSEKGQLTENFIMGQLKFSTDFKKIESIKRYFFEDDDYSSLRIAIFKRDGKIIFIDNAQQRKFLPFYNELKKIYPVNKTQEKPARYISFIKLFWSWVGVNVVVALYILIHQYHLQK
jgi:hypothetical protein